MSRDKWRREEIERLVEAQNRPNYPDRPESVTQLQPQTGGELAWHPEAVFGFRAAIEAYVERLLWPRIGR